MESTLVSIITPTYNCGEYIAKTIESVIAQTFTNWEMIIVDDCSTDDTCRIVLDYFSKDSRIKYFCLETNSGAAVARNTALQMANGRWIAFLDSDDLWEPTKLERQIAFMKDNDYAFSYHDYIEIDEYGNELGIYVSGKRRVSKLDMFACCWPGCLSVIYDAKKIGLIQIGDVKRNNDTAMWLQIIRKADCYLLKESLARYRRRKNSITPKPLWKRIWAHYPLFRVAEKMNPIAATFWVFMNLVGNMYKKIVYITKYD